MAEALLNKLAAGRARAVSAGTEPAKAVDPTVVKVMREVGIDISHQKPKKLTPEMIEQANRVITMGCGVEGVCPATLIETEDWGLEDPEGKELEKVRETRDQIQDKVVALLKNMDKKDT
jgi:protein-tyrosine-phosphatase